MGIQSARQFDKFYTRPDVAKFCLQLLNEALTDREVHKPMLWVEPSAGAGVFLNLLPEPRVGIDVAPDGPGILEEDFLGWFPEVSEGVVTVGNPPFGRNASKAVEFFNHAARFSQAIGMIVPRTFEKESLQRRLDRSFNCISSTPLELDAFTLEGLPYSVPTCFQVWVRSAEPRQIYKPSLTHPDFEFVKKAEAEFAVQRVGSGAGAVKLNFGNSAETSHYFIRSQCYCAGTLIARFSGLDFSEVKARSAGNPSIGKGELVEIYQDRWGGACRLS